jgi:hypothetical protein
MKSVHLGEKFDLKIHESVIVEGENLVVTIKSVSRLQVPKQGDQFILQLTLARGDASEEVNLDGSFQFPTNAIQVLRGDHRISVPDIDFMARFATLVIERVTPKPQRAGKKPEKSGKKKI